MVHQAMHQGLDSSTRLVWVRRERGTALVMSVALATSHSTTTATMAVAVSGSAVVMASLVGGVVVQNVCPQSGTGVGIKVRNLSVVMCTAHMWRTVSKNRTTQKTRSQDAHTQDAPPAIHATSTLSNMQNGGRGRVAMHEFGGERPCTYRSTLYHRLFCFRQHLALANQFPRFLLVWGCGSQRGMCC